MTRTKPHNVIIATPPRWEVDRTPERVPHPIVKPNRHERRKAKAKKR